MHAKRKTRDVFLYFDNDAKVRAPVDAEALIGKVSERLGRKKQATAAPPGC